MIDRLFDIMNSRSPRAGGFKGPLGNLNWSEKVQFLLRARKYLIGLVMQDGKPLHKSKRFFKMLNGLICSIVLHQVHKMLSRAWSQRGMSGILGGNEFYITNERY